MHIDVYIYIYIYITKFLAKTLSLLLGTISDAHINNSSSHFNKIININMKNKSFTCLDIKSLNTNIPVDKCIERLENLLRKTNTILLRPVSLSLFLHIYIILDKTDCISHSTNTLGKGINPIILPLAMDNSRAD